MTDGATGRPLRSTASQLGLAGVLAVSYFIVTVVALHFLQPELDPVDQFISEYAVGDFGWLLKIAFFTVGAGTLAIALGLRMTLQPGRRVMPAIILVALAGFGFFGAGAFNADPLLESGDYEGSPSGIAHDLSSFVLFLSLIAAAFLFRGVFDRDLAWRSFSRPAFWFGIAMATALVATLALVPIVGIVQRIFVPIVMSWLAALGWQIHQRAAEPQGVAGTGS